FLVDMKWLHHHESNKLTARTREFSIKDYQRRYLPVNNQLISQQFQNLRDIASACRSHGCDLYLVNMPLTKTNTDILPDGFYDQFRSRLHDFCENTGASYVDLADMPFAPADFKDLVHLNGVGGSKAYDYVAVHIAEKEHAQELAAKSKGVM